MKVWVVMGNDYPDSVWDSERLANEYVASKKSIYKEGSRIIYWRAYEFHTNTRTNFGE